MLSTLAAAQGVAPLFIDLNRTHATHPLWPGHARFHVVSQTLIAFMAAIPEVGLVWWGAAWCFYLAALLTAIPMIGFVLAMLFRGLYGGTLHDPMGIPPGRIRFRGRVREFDVNVVIVSAGLAVLAAAVVLFRSHL